ncbi:DNA-binding protein WhiA [Clostridium formicaceticum]|uniref:Probable cell division protein WhiA n=1 Tax=Clostridium formicaceticum TaxID=1497 RepID=A0AAC9RQ25_9CLOT|nr:DNA-binding protein WhiA [Clostridium formicaceticum]AOY74779.1 DNA-binding protein WhiA [Clostridium formicaceticum]ARE89170.1 Sporulation transcription regulator WhiA [Clostridium formicaceticum]
MSFSANTKSELARIFPEEHCCKLAELAALIRMSGTLQLTGLKKINLRINTENPSTARKIFKYIKKLFEIHTEVMIRRNSRLKKNNYYMMMISHAMGSVAILKKVGILKEDNRSFDITYEVPMELLTKPCCKRAYLRGAFLGGGSISAPEKTYHLEFVTNSLQHSENLKDLINEFNLNAKTVERKGSYVVYIKEGDQVVDVLNIIGAHKALLDLENIRIYKQMRNDINRIVNCETANLSKTVNASMRQIENIEYIRDTIGIHGLPEGLREIAELRLNYQEASLKELGQMVNPAIGKSGVNHRLRKIEEIAKRLQMKKQ